MHRQIKYVGNGPLSCFNLILDNGFIVSLECQIYCFVGYIAGQRMLTCKIRVRALMHTPYKDVIVVGSSRSR